MSNIVRKKVALGLSGGVDSAVSAYLLIQAGYDVTGIFMQCWDARADGCKSDEDKAYAIETASKLGINFEHLDLRKEYKEKVMSYFYSEYSAGRTPNPDIMCNKEIKFGLFYKWAMDSGYDFVATGHYARTTEDINYLKTVTTESSGANIGLYKGVDPSKDQSYFLYMLDKSILEHTLFPVGNLNKKEVREIALSVGLPPAKRPDSVGICFIGEVSIKDFLKKSIPTKMGDVLLATGEKIGTHEGAYFYTIGQRHGFTVNKYVGTPLYVIEKDVNKNILIVGPEPSVYRKEFFAEHLHFISDRTKAILFQDLKCDVRIRHLGTIYTATLSVVYTEPPLMHSTIRILLDAPIFGVASGQSVVFYKGDEVLGGGIIK